MESSARNMIPHCMLHYRRHCVYVGTQERMMTSFLFGRPEERVTSYSGRGESRISRVYYK